MISSDDHKLLRKKQRELAKQVKRLEELRNRAPSLIREANFRKSNTIPPPDDEMYLHQNMTRHHVKINSDRRSEWGEVMVLISKMILIISLFSILFYWWTLIQS